MIVMLSGHLLLAILVAMAMLIQVAWVCGLDDRDARQVFPLPSSSPTEISEKERARLGHRSDHARDETAVGSSRSRRLGSERRIIPNAPKLQLGFSWMATSSMNAIL